jgi:hypothetical protein
MKRAIALSILVAGSLCASASVAGLGTECVTMQPSDPFLHSYNGQIVNTSVTNNSTFICAATSTSPSATRSVTVYDRNPSSNVSCFLSRSNSSGVVTWSSGIVPSSGSPSTPQTLSFPTPGGSGNTYGVSCFIPLSPGLGQHSGLVSFDLT